MLFSTFLIGAVGMLQSPRAASDNWLIILFRLSIRPFSTQADALNVVSPLDVGLMLLFGILMAATYPALRSISRAWAAVTVILPLMGIPIFLATGTAGRSAVLLAGFISSILALRSQYTGSGPASTGILASALRLFVGDFGTAAFSPSTLLAVFIAVGYILWTVWLLLISMELIRRGRRAAT